MTGDIHKLLPTLIGVIATRIAKREHGERYEGYESSQREAAEDYASAAMGVMAAFGMLDSEL